MGIINVERLDHSISVQLYFDYKKIEGRAAECTKVLEQRRVPKVSGIINLNFNCYTSLI